MKTCEVSSRPSRRSARQMPDRHRQALAQGARGDLHPGGAGHVGVALQVRADLAQAHQVLAREVAVLGERRVLDRGGVALGEHEAVALAPVGVRRIVAKHPVVEGGDDVGRRQRGVEVAGFRHSEHPHALDAEHGRVALELFDRGLGAGRGSRLGVGNGLQVRHHAASRSPRIRPLCLGGADGIRMLRARPESLALAAARVAAKGTPVTLRCAPDGKAQAECSRPCADAGWDRGGSAVRDAAVGQRALRALHCPDRRRWTGRAAGG